MFDEIRSPVGDLESLLASSSWFDEWEKNKYAIGAFAECCRELRALQERDLGAIRKRVERKITDLKVHYERKVVARHSGAGEAEEGNDS